MHAPAGGRSSLDLFGGFAEAEARREAMPARGRRTGYAPPGGRAEAAPKAAAAAAPVAARADPYAARAAPRAAPEPEAVAPSRAYAARGSAPRPGAEAAPRAEPAPRSAAAPLRGSGTSANVFASGANQNCGNFITDRPTSRVLSAPGGRSSIVLG